MIVVACFPKAAALGFLEFKGSALLEKTDKFAEIGAVMDSLRKDVNVIRHEAIRVEAKRVGGGAFEKEMEGMFGMISVREMRRAAVTTDRDEIGLLAKVVFGS
ncbi:MAG: hypothetical protein WA789_12925 [Candidatus Acidiferrum sp.]